MHVENAYLVGEQRLGDEDATFVANDPAQLHMRLCGATQHINYMLRHHLLVENVVAERFVGVPVYDGPLINRQHELLCRGATIKAVEACLPRMQAATLGGELGRFVDAGVVHRRREHLGNSMR